MSLTKNQQKISKLPPIELIERIVDGPCNCIRTYFKLWRAKDEKNNVLISRTLIPDKFYTTPERFLRDVVSLSSEHLLTWEKNNINNRVIYKIYLKA